MENSKNTTMVSPDGRYERLAGKLENFKTNNMTTKEAEGVQDLKETFALKFLEYCWKFEGTSYKQTGLLNEDEIKCLAEARISRRVKIRALFWMAFFLSSPVGWTMYLADKDIADSIIYFRNLLELRKIYGKDYFPVAEILKMAADRDDYGIGE